MIFKICCDVVADGGSDDSNSYTAEHRYMLSHVMTPEYASFLQLQMIFLK